MPPTISSMLLPVQSSSPLIGPPSDPFSPASRTKPKKKNSAPLRVVNDDPSTCKISDNLEDSCKTYCKICGEAILLVKMRSHTLTAHGIQITKYKESHGPFEIIEKVFHKCHLCGKLVLLDSDALGGHIKGTHKMSEKEYKGKYCFYAQEARNSNRSEEPVKIKKKVLKTKVSQADQRKSEKPFNPFTDVYYDCDLKECDQCDKKSLVGHLAELAEESLMVPNEERNEDEERMKLDDEKLLSEECLQDKESSVEEHSSAELPSQTRMPLYTKSMPQMLQSCLLKELEEPSDFEEVEDEEDLENFWASDIDTTRDTESSEEEYEEDSSIDSEDEMEQDNDDRKNENDAKGVQLNGELSEVKYEDIEVDLEEDVDFGSKSYSEITEELDSLLGLFN